MSLVRSLFNALVNSPNAKEGGFLTKFLPKGDVPAPKEAIFVQFGLVLGDAQQPHESITITNT